MTAGTGEIRAAGYGEYGWSPGPGYRVLRLLRRGQDFETYDAWSQDRHARCVIKTICRDRRSPDNRARLRREGHLLTALDHPHLVRGYDVPVRPRLMVVMETLTGATLSNLLRQQRLSAHDVAHVGAQVASALRFLHAQGVLHLDVKPGNVIIGAGRARLIDLSLAQPPGYVRAGYGTADYLSPEQGAGGEVTTAADAWGLGLTLYAAAAGGSPFDLDAEPAGTAPRCATVPQGMHCKTCGDQTDYPQRYVRAPRIGSVRRLPRPLAALLDACLEPQPGNRPTMTEIDHICSQVAGADRPVWYDQG